MNESLLKWLSAGVVLLVVSSALWLAGQVQSTHRATSYRLALAQPAQGAALPARAASATGLFKVGVR